MSKSTSIDAYQQYFSTADFLDRLLRRYGTPRELAQHVSLQLAAHPLPRARIERLLVLACRDDAPTPTQTELIVLLANRLATPDEDEDDVATVDATTGETPILDEDALDGPTEDDDEVPE
jgi:hypothetical protein